MKTTKKRDPPNKGVLMDPTRSKWIR
jgi:hypothetical protein